MKKAKNEKDKKLSKGNGFEVLVTPEEIFAMSIRRKTFNNKIMKEI